MFLIFSYGASMETAWLLADLTRPTVCFLLLRFVGVRAQML